MYLCSHSFSDQGGMYVFQIFDTFSASGIILLTICFCESMVIAWVYGAKRFYDNMAMMLGYTVNPVLMICWKFLTPLLTFVSKFLFLSVLFTYQSVLNFFLAVI